MTTAIQTKKCTKCGEVKSLDDFSPHSRGLYGRQSRCKVCNATGEKARVSSRKNRKITPRERHPAQLKRCPVCEKMKPLSDFAASRSQASGCQSHCKVCQAVEKAAYQLRNKQRETTPHEEYPERLKHCSQCGETKPLSDFYANHRNTDGCATRCKLCSHELVIRWRNQHLTQMRARQKKYNQNYCERHPDRRKESQQNWQKRHPAKTRATVRRRRALKRGLHETFNAKQEAFVRDFWDNRCAICGRWHQPGEKAFPIDHWQPLSKGHVLTMATAVLMCESCNGGKWNRYPNEFYSADVISRIEKKLELQTATWEIRASLAEGSLVL